jgi:hypothetical protein
VKDVDLERSRDVVDGVAARRVRELARRVLEDPELAGQRVEVASVDRMQSGRGNRDGELREQWGTPLGRVAFEKKQRAGRGVDVNRARDRLVR